MKLGRQQHVLDTTSRIAFDGGARARDGLRAHRHQAWLGALERWRKPARCSGAMPKISYLNKFGKWRATARLEILSGLRSSLTYGGWATRGGSTRTHSAHPGTRQ